METRRFLIGGIVCIDSDRPSVSMCGSDGWDHSDGERCFQGFCFQLVQSCWDKLLLWFQYLMFKGFQKLSPLLFKSQWRVGVFVTCVQNFYNTSQNNSFSFGDVLFLKFPWCIHLWDCFYGSSYYLRYKFRSLLKYISDESQRVIKLM